MRERAEGLPPKEARSSRYVRMVGVLLTAVMILAAVGGTVATYRLGQSAESENALAINAFDLNSALREISGNLQLPNVEQTTSLEKDTQSIVSGARQSIGLVRSNGTLPPLMKLAIDRTTTISQHCRRRYQGTYLRHAERGPLGRCTWRSRRPSSYRGAGVRATRHPSMREREESPYCSSSSSWSLAECFGKGEQRRRSAVIASQAEGLAEFEAMIENSTDLFFLTDARNRTLYCSPSAARFLGMSTAEICDAPIDQFIHDDDLVKATNAFDTVRAFGAAGPLDLSVRHHDGGWRTIEVIANESVARIERTYCGMAYA